MDHGNLPCTLQSPPPRRPRRNSAQHRLPGRHSFVTCLRLVLAGLVLVSPASAAAQPLTAASLLGSLNARLARQSDPVIAPPQTPTSAAPESPSGAPQNLTPQDTSSPGTTAPPVSPDASSPDASTPDASTTEPQTDAQRADDSPAAEAPSPPATATSPTNASRPPVPIPPDANAMAWRREILAVSLLGVMGVGCTVAAFFAVWILSKNLRPSDS